MARGIVTWFSEKKGYGFIERNDGTPVFVHYSDIEDFRHIVFSEGDWVKFEMEQEREGHRAINVIKLFDG